MDPQLFSDLDASVGGECESSDRQIARPCHPDGRISGAHGAVDVRDRRAEVVVHAQESAFFLGRNVPDACFAMLHKRHASRRIHADPAGS